VVELPELDAKVPHGPEEGQDILVIVPDGLLIIRFGSDPQVRDLAQVFGVAPLNGLDNLLFPANGNIVFGPAQPLEEDGFVIPKLRKSLVFEAQQNQQHSRVLPLHRVDHIFRGQDAAVIFLQDGIGGLPQSQEVEHGPGQDHHHQNQGDPITEKNFFPKGSHD
jgi:hypothetical protein